MIRSVRFTAALILLAIVFSLGQYTTAEPLVSSIPAQLELISSPGDGGFSSSALIQTKVNASGEGFVNVTIYLYDSKGLVDAQSCSYPVCELNFTAPADGRFFLNASAAYLSSP